MIATQKRNSLHLAFLFIFLCSLLVIPAPASLAAPANQAQTCETATLHYHRRNGDYAGWGLHIWGPAAQSVTWEAPLQPAGEDDFGLFWLVPMNPGADLLNYIVHLGNEKDPGPDQILRFAENGCEIWLVQGKDTQFQDLESALASLVVVISTPPALTENEVILHYRRTNADYDGWGLHVWGDTAIDGVTWTSPLKPAGQDDYGLYWIVPMKPGASTLNYIVHNGDVKDPGPDQSLNISALGREIWLIQGTGDQYTDPEKAKEGILTAGLGDIKNKAQAHWLTRDTIAWPAAFDPHTVYKLHYDPLGEIIITPEGIQGGQEILLEFAGDNLDPKMVIKYPHLWKSTSLKLPPEALSSVPEILKGQIAISASTPDGQLINATALQIPGVLDDLYANDEPLGVTWEGDIPSLSLWAPTARSVTLVLFADSSSDVIADQLEMSLNAENGIWSITGNPTWKNQFFLYDVEVYVRQEGGVVNNLVTDPYSLSLSMNSARSQIVDLEDPALAPAGWNELAKPQLSGPMDIVLYELHLRDFSINDPSVPEEQRGTYLAFTHTESNGMQHLKRLAAAGLTHIHLLPVFDIASIDEDKSTWLQVDSAQLSALPPDSSEQQAAVQAIRSSDGFNWGYDPFHYTTPEGSYSTNPDGSTRIIEFRQMVEALNQSGLRVVMDVVYNHTNASGQAAKSVLDRVVPGYYHRLDANGTVASSTCCANTATEHAMMQKLMVDSLLTWAKEYKVDGFRFDLMGHHMVSNMEAVRAALDGLTLEQDGVDGKSIYIYGEGWDFGEVANGARGKNATQLNLAGTGIGTFNDRIRDAVRGGSPFSDYHEQGYASGLYLIPNEAAGMDLQSQLSLLLKLEDNIRIGLAGNLADFSFESASGQTVLGSDLRYNNNPVGYTKSPQENIIYISAHDNETLFDILQVKAAKNTPLSERVRMDSLGLSLVALSQGIPFIHAGDEILRSKSLDRNSYDSGDWFNRLDFTYASDNWGVGLPLQDSNGDKWPIIQPLLANPELKPAKEVILLSLEHFEEMLQIRKSSPLFRLGSAAEIQARLRFHNTGPDQIPGLIVMSLSDDDAQLDPNYDLIFVFFNASDQEANYTLADLQGAELALHPVQVNSSDPVVRSATFDPASKQFKIPGLTTAVFVGSGTFQAVVEPGPTAAGVTEPSVELPAPTPPLIEATQTSPDEGEAAPGEPQAGSTLIPWAAGGIVLVVLAGLYLVLKRKQS